MISLQAVVMGNQQAEIFCLYISKNVLVLFDLKHSLMNVYFAV